MKMASAIAMHVLRMFFYHYYALPTFHVGLLKFNPVGIGERWLGRQWVPADDGWDIAEGNKNKS